MDKALRGILLPQSHYLIKDQELFLDAVESLTTAVPFDQGYFCGDNLITYKRNLRFLREGEAWSAITAAHPSSKECSRAWRTHVVTWAARQSLSVPGDFIEAGVDQGYTARVVCNFLNFATVDRQYWLYDLFADDLFDKVRDRFSDVPNARLIKGVVPESLAQGIPKQVAFLHLDMSSAIAEIGMLEALIDRISPGGIVVLDDYGWQGHFEQHEAHAAWFKERNRFVLELPTGQGMVVK